MLIGFPGELRRTRSYNAFGGREANIKAGQAVGSSVLMKGSDALKSSLKIFHISSDISHLASKALTWCFDEK